MRKGKNQNKCPLFVQASEILSKAPGSCKHKPVLLDSLPVYLHTYTAAMHNPPAPTFPPISEHQSSPNIHAFHPPSTNERARHQPKIDRRQSQPSRASPTSLSPPSNPRPWSAVPTQPNPPVRPALPGPRPPFCSPSSTFPHVDTANLQQQAPFRQKLEDPGRAGSSSRSEQASSA